jgi:hypothetical protein
MYCLIARVGGFPPRTTTAVIEPMFSIMSDNA